MTTPAHRVLVVDDDPDIRETIALILESSGCEVRQAANGAAALELLREGEPPCLVLLDLMMPVMDGRAFRAVQREDPALQDIPVVVLSGDGRLERKAEELGIHAFLRKPIGIEDLLAVVDHACTHGHGPLPR